MKTIIKASVTVLLSLLVITQIKAQGKVSGTLYDENNQPSAFATVALLAALDSSLVKGNITDEKGNYEFNNVADGEYFIRISYVGYKTTHSDRISISSQNRSVKLGKTMLEELSKTLDEVTITAQRPLIEKQSDRLVMNLENSILAKGATADEILKMAPLVSSSMNGTLTLRGKPNVMILIDGKTIPNATLNTILQSLSAEEIEKLEIITNPSAKYDAAASGGVINIVTKKGLQLGFNGTYHLYASQGLYEKVYTGAGINYRTKKINVYGGINYAFGKNYRNEFYRRNFPNNSIENNTEYKIDYKSPNAKIGLDINLNKNHTLGISIDGNVSNTNIDLLTKSVFRNILNYPDSSLNTIGDWKYKYNMYNLNVDYKGTLSDKGNEISLNATQTIYKQDSRQILTYQTFSDLGAPISNIEKLRTEIPSDVNITIAQTDYTHPFKENIKGEAGLKYTGINFVNKLTHEALLDDRWMTTSLSNSGYTENVAAGYINVNATFENFFLQAGVRGENTTTTVVDTLKRRFFDIFPSFFIQRNINDNHVLSVSYSRKIDRPVYENLIPVRIYVDLYTLREGNPYLQPQYSHSFEISNTIRDITLLAGYTSIKDAMIDIPFQDLETQITTLSFRNFSQIETYNLSVILPIAPTAWWQTNNTLTGMYNNLKASDLNSINFKTSIYSFTFNSINTFSFGKDWKGELVGYYNSSNQYGIFRVLPRYAVSIGIGKDILKMRGNLKFSFDDIFWSEQYMGKAKVGSIDQSLRNYWDSRRFRIAFTYKFGKQTVKPAKNRSLGNESEKNRLKL